MITAQEIKKEALRLGADLVGIGDMANFEGTPPRKDPRFIAPRAKRIIGLGFRVLRGSLRGIEEGTHFFQYPEMSVVHIDEVMAPTTLRRLACFIEDRGYEGVVQRSVPDRRHGEDEGTNPERQPCQRIAYAEPVAPGKPAPDVLMDFRHAAYVCGLGEIGMGGFVLTPEFGPLARFAFILTDAPIEADPFPVKGALCDKCGKCAAACPGAAIEADRQVSQGLGGQAISHAALDEWQCAAHYRGVNPEINPFMPDEAAKSMPSPSEKLGEERSRQYGDWANSFYWPMRFGYQNAICGKACWRSCLVHLEQRGMLGHKFNIPFRNGPEWRVVRQPKMAE